MYRKHKTPQETVKTDKQMEQVEEYKINQGVVLSTVGYDEQSDSIGFKVLPIDLAFTTHVFSGLGVNADN